MANFTTPFANNASRRLPNADEKVNGFPCGPADQMLFNGLFHRLEAELGNLITFAGLTGTDADNSQVRQAIQALIAAATGGGDTSQFLLVSQARARLPIYPEFVTSDGKINITAPATGTVRVPGSVDFIHRGMYLISTEQTDFNTVQSKTYHLRWNPDDGFTLNDLSNGTYNPGTLAETDPSFDSTYDDMLVARIVTNSGNLATITPLANKHQLTFTDGIAATNYQAPDTNGARGDILVGLDWARTPNMKSYALVQLSATGGAGVNDWDASMYASYPSTLADEIPASRYQVSYTMMYDFSIGFTHQVNMRA